MAAIIPTIPDSDRSARIPVLEPGDHLSRAEFERRYEAMPHVRKAELIEGAVHMPSPVRWDRHATPHFDIVGLLWVYVSQTPGVEGGDNATIRLDLENEPQPDVALIISPMCGGRVRKTKDDYIEGAPELVVEVAASSASFDLNTKLRVYRKNEVREYLVWRVQDRALDWFSLRNGQFERLSTKPEGYIESEVFPGLRLDQAALAQFDRQKMLKVLQTGIESTAHAAFVERLQKR